MAITTAEGSYQDFSCTGGMQSITIPHAGIFKFECWGAGGDGGRGGKGGYSVGFRLCSGGERFYICVGQTGQDGKGGYNSGITQWGWETSNYGGGATHIATADGELKSLSGNRGAVLLVAGGGGGQGENNGTGGDGGGLEGGWGNGVAGGTQNGPGTPLYEYDCGNGAFGQGGDADNYYDDHGQTGGRAGTGGGGWYGGNGGRGYRGGGAGGGGGSGYIGGLPGFSSADGTWYAPETQVGGGSANTTDGRARITFVRLNQIPVVFNGTCLTALYVNGVKVTSLIYGGVKLFMRRIKRRMRGCFA